MQYIKIFWKIRVYYSQGAYILRPVQDSHGNKILQYKEAIVKGSVKQFTNLLDELKATEVEVGPPSKRFLSAEEIAINISQGYSTSIWCLKSRWLNFLLHRGQFINMGTVTEPGAR